MQTTEGEYASALATATRTLSERIPVDGFPSANEHAKTVSDALNNTWVEGISTDAWVSAAQRRIERQA